MSALWIQVTNLIMFSGVAWYLVDDKLSSTPKMPQCQCQWIDKCQTITCFLNFITVFYSVCYWLLLWSGHIQGLVQTASGDLIVLRWYYWGFHGLAHYQWNLCPTKGHLRRQMLYQILFAPKQGMSMMRCIGLKFEDCHLMPDNLMQCITKLQGFVWYHLELECILWLLVMFDYALQTHSVFVYTKIQ